MCIRDRCSSLVMNFEIQLFYTDCSKWKLKKLKNILFFIFLGSMIYDKAHKSFRHSFWNIKSTYMASTLCCFKLLFRKKIFQLSWGHYNRNWLERVTVNAMQNTIILFMLQRITLHILDTRNLYPMKNILWKNCI